MEGGPEGAAQRLAAVQKHLEDVGSTDATAHLHRIHPPVYRKVVTRSNTIMSGAGRRLLSASHKSLT